MSEQNTENLISAFDEAVQNLTRVTPKRIPFVIFKKTQNKPTEVRPDAIPEVVPFLFRLDSCAASVAQISTYENKGWPIVYSNLPVDAMRGRPEIISIYQHLESHKIYRSDSASQPVVEEANDVKAKLNKRQRADAEAKAKAEAETKE